MWCWEPNPGPLQEQQMLFLTEPSLQPPVFNFSNVYCVFLTETASRQMPTEVRRETQSQRNTEAGASELQGGNKIPPQEDMVGHLRSAVKMTNALNRNGKTRTRKDTGGVSEKMEVSPAMSKV